MTDARIDDDDKQMNMAVLTPEVLVSVFDAIRDIGCSVGQRDAYCDMLGYLSQLSEEANDELTRNENSPLAMAQVMTLSKMVKHLRDRPAQHAQRITRDVALLTDVFEAMGLLPKDAVDVLKARATARAR